jgi:uroporphyrinogen-III synthase
LARLVITRPDGQADGLKQRLEAQGHQVVHRPLMNIESVDLLEDDEAHGARIQARQHFLNLDEFQRVIAISANAARLGMEKMDEFWPQWPIGIEWYAVGPASAEPMEALGLKVELPDNRFDSEGLLALPCMHQLSGQRILIWRGIGGRETLAETLRARGAEVEYAELYRRQPQIYPLADWDTLLADNDWLVLSSGQALDILEDQIPDLPAKARGLVLPSQRVAKKAKSRGYSSILVPPSARDQDVLDAINRHCQPS